MSTDRIRALAARLVGGNGARHAVRHATAIIATLLTAGLAVGLATTGGTAASWTASVTVTPPSIRSASITAYVSDLSSHSTTFTSSALTKTSSFVVDNTGTTMASATLRLGLGAGSSPALAASTTLTLWDIPNAASCTETAVPVNGWTAAWNGFPLLTGTLAPNEHEMFCLRSHTSASNLTSTASITPTISLDLTLPGTGWSSSAATSATLSVAPDPAVVGNDYTAAVRADGANRYWRLGETSGSILYDLIGNDDAYAGSGLTRGITGPNGSDANAATAFSGDANGTAGTRTAITSPQSFAVEAWFKTTSTTGGKIVGFGSSSAGLSGSYDRHLYLDAAGRVSFGVWPNYASTITTSGAFNDGRWHHAVGNLGSGGQELYVDGDLIGSLPNTSSVSYGGYWRIGGDSPWAGDAWFDGAIDEVAVYSAPLSAAKVKRHYGISTGVPAASFTSSATDYTAGVDASASSDYDGSLASYSWNWGDGTPAGTGVTASHAYATKGTYPVALTVADNAGNTDTVTQLVTVADVTAPTAPSNLTVTSNTDAGVGLSWTASTDSVGVAGYDILRDGAQIGTTTSTDYTDATARSATAYSYSVRAKDAAGNASVSTTMTVTTAAFDTAAWYSVSTANGLCLDSTSPTSYSPLVQATCATSTSQNFQFQPASAGTHRAAIRSNPGYVWNVSNASTSAGGAIVLYPISYGWNEEWILTKVSGSVYTFTQNGNGLCLTAPATAGAALTQETCVAGAPNQRFTLTVTP